VSFVFLVSPILANYKIDIDEYLPDETLRWCQGQLLGMSFDSENPQETSNSESSDSPHRLTYLRLCEKVHQQGMFMRLEISHERPDFIKKSRHSCMPRNPLELLFPSNLKYVKLLVEMTFTR
jgi:hypothetical protein